MACVLAIAIVVAVPLKPYISCGTQTPVSHTSKHDGLSNRPNDLRQGTLLQLVLCFSPNRSLSKSRIHHGLKIKRCTQEMLSLEGVLYT